MKGRLAAFAGVFCIALLIVSGAYAGKPTPKPDKPGNPPRPGNIAVECIEFTGWDLVSVPEGGTVVVGCCPNAGPSPEYTMTLNIEGLHEDDIGQEFVGHLFAKPVRTKFKGQTTRRYLVQFNTWNWETDIPGLGDYFIEIYADEEDIAYDETTDVLTVTFNNDHEDDTATVWALHAVSPDCVPSYPYCATPCANMTPNCVASEDPNCNHPCNEEFTDVNVSFIMTKTTDLTNCPVVVVE